MKPFKFLTGNKDVETISEPIEEGTIYRAVIAENVVTFIEFRDGMMFRQPDSNYLYDGFTSFTVNNIKYHYIWNSLDVYNRFYDNYILLRDAQEIEGIDLIIRNLQSYGSTEMFLN